MNLLALDIGDKKVGLAVAKRGVVFEKSKIEFKNHGELIKRLMIICREDEIKKIIVGIPQSDCYPEQMQKNKTLAEKIGAKLNLPVEFVDEQFTSAEARRILSEQGLPPEQIHAREDSFAARLILEEYLH